MNEPERVVERGDRSVEPGYASITFREILDNLTDELGRLGSQEEYLALASKGESTGNHLAVRRENALFDLGRFLYIMLPNGWECKCFCVFDIIDDY